MARLPCYMWCTSTNATWSGDAQHHLQARYEGAALSFIEGQIKGWPVPDQLTVDPPFVTVQSVAISADGQTATLQTTETWSVRGTGGTKLFAEQDAHHTITMVKRPAHVFDKWVVSNIA
ncbi:MAG TPA: hypothetical protein VHQ86_03745 [Candidatus Saccharimonadia bacterium]|nr:hypothetical protein [Candidatus Saccharimonadia bacterium]